MRKFESPHWRRCCFSETSVAMATGGGISGSEAEPIHNLPSRSPYPLESLSLLLAFNSILRRAVNKDVCECVVFLLDAMCSSQ